MIVFLLLWLIYFVLHSVLAADTVKAWFAQKMGTTFRYYRIGYNFVAVVTLLPPLAWQSTRSPILLWQSNAITVFIAIGLIAAGLVTGYLAMKNYSVGEFSGLSYLQEQKSTHRLVTTGLNHYVRHPLYSASLLLISGYLLYSGTDIALGLFGIVLAYLLIGSWLEERKLEATFGQPYQLYKKRVKRLIPHIY